MIDRVNEPRAVRSLVRRERECESLLEEAAIHYHLGRAASTDDEKFDGLRRAGSTDEGKFDRAPVSGILEEKNGMVRTSALTMCRTWKTIVFAGGATASILAVMVACVSRPSAPELSSHAAYDGGGYGYAPIRVPGFPWQSKGDADSKSLGCLSCHSPMDSKTLHGGDRFYLGCTDCHGGDATAMLPADTTRETEAYQVTELRAHVQPRFPEHWPTSANPKRLGADLMDESFEFVRFANPGDLRVAHTTCGVVGCHPDEVAKVRTSMMTHGAMLWSAALYNNGAVPFKDAHFGEAYGPDGTPLLLRTIPPPTPQEIKMKGILPELWPLPRWNVSQPGNILRVFERGGRKKGEIGNPNPLDPPGEPENKLSNRGYGTILRTDPVFLGLQKTRLLDPMLSFLGTNDHPGDYRSSGCTACHVVYANDRDRAHTGPEWKASNNRGFSETADPTIKHDESGHPMKHVMTRGIPSSQCVVCHVHPGTAVENSYFGTIWWDNETDAEGLYLKAGEHRPTPWETDEIQRSNPENAALRGRWSDPDFLADMWSKVNPTLKNVQFADFHGHGWVFRNVYSQKHDGTLLDKNGESVAADDPQKFEKAAHLQDIHAEMGMHCVDCHFEQDSHGNGKLYGEMRAAVEIRCEDCHGTLRERATLETSGPAAPAGGHDLRKLQPTPSGKLRFERSGESIVQRGMVEKDREWTIVQVADTLDPTSEKFARARYAHTIRKDGKTWGSAPANDSDLAHPSSEMNCIACHTSWTTSCFGCHLPMVANQRKPMLHGEGDVDRNWVQYNFQTLRNDIFMLGKDGTVAGQRISPVRSSCAVLVGSQNDKREWIYSQQQTVSASGFSGHAFTTYVPHTVRARETKTCTDCHLSQANDNNAWLAQVMLLGTNFVNFIGHYCWVATGEGGFQAVSVSERSEPQAVIGSNLHRIAYPDEYARHVRKS
ncbi:MAG: hypothetical protein HY292_16260 [Planctomycetes bacterium]|nr:hypothetical protein [Planctomycetota bacterium]